MASSRTPLTKFTTSADGTRIAYETTGSGPALVLVDGAMCSRELGTVRKLATALAGSFTVTIYDRRGRGESGNTAGYDVAREVEDIDAVIDAAGGRAFVSGQSSGAVLAARAAAASPERIRGIVIYEPPFVVDSSRPPLPDNYDARLAELLDAGDRGGAVRWFLSAAVGLPKPLIALMRFMPGWSKTKAAAPTLPHDMAIMGNGESSGSALPGEVVATLGRVGVPTAVLYGGKSPEWMANGAAAVASAIPGAVLEELPGQTHMVKASALGPAIERHCGVGEAAEPRLAAVRAA